MASLGSPGVSPRRQCRTGELPCSDSESDTSAIVASTIDSLGVGSYQLLLISAIGLSSLSESIEMGAIAPLHTALARTFHLDNPTRSQLPLVAFIGSGVGLASVGFLCDHCGRRAAIVASQALIVVVMVLTALLPLTTSVSCILMLRFCAGFGSAVQGPAGIALAVESCPRAFRAQLLFRIALFSNIGFLIEAFGIQWLMPSFGEAESDNWRLFCLITAGVAAVALPLVMMLYESPCFLGVVGKIDKCTEALYGIAHWNGKRAIPTSIFSRTPAISRTVHEAFDAWVDALKVAVWSCGSLIGVLCLIDGFRTFFVTGSSYLWKDVVMRVHEGGILGPTQIYVISSFAPLVGLFLAERLVSRGQGIANVTFWTSLVATASLSVLSNGYMRSSTSCLLTLMTTTKLTYGTLWTCVALLKVRSFPTQIRVSAFSLISIVAKFFSALAPTMVEAMKTTEEASSWNPTWLSLYIGLLGAAVFCSGSLALMCLDSDIDVMDPKGATESECAKRYGSIDDARMLPGERTLLVAT